MTQQQTALAAARLILADIRAAGRTGVPAGAVQAHFVAAGYSYALYFNIVDALGRLGLLQRRGQRFVAPVIPW